MTGGAGSDDRDDPTLLAAHVAGDHEAFGVLFSRHRERLWAVALRTTGDPEEAADGLQDALVSAFRRAASYRGDAAVTTWLHRIVVNACLDRIRHRQVRSAVPLPEDEGADVRPLGRADAAPAADPLLAAELADRRRTVIEALRTLAPDQRAALVLVDMEGYSVDAAAAILDVAPGTVKSRCSRGRAKLAPLLAGLRATGNPAEGRRVPQANGPDVVATGGGDQP